ncbi:glutamate receptor ionotropic, kainate 1 [Caerostris extrusa]|uniref:Glutamate receptor ionotropic, kainate 1 n=1 Tax=Caerostris extrusa TaxID=172846 RepID=A0AAV4P933_CAEEX|nr:glutamate receptor ionotropic, kainate 1 [Caerostris extrusa]
MRKKLSFSTILTTVVGNLFKQPVNVTISTVSIRILYSFLVAVCDPNDVELRCCFFLSFLTVPLREKGVQTVMELCQAVKTGSYKALMPKGIFFAVFDRE